MADIRLILSDIDGTIVRQGEHAPTSAVAKAVRQLHDRGIQLTTVTGRPYEKTNQLLAALNLGGPCIFDGGASIRDAVTGDLLWHKWLEVERLKQIAHILLPHSTLIDFFPECREIPAQHAMVSSITQSAPYVYAHVWSEQKQLILSQLSAVSNLSVHLGHAYAPDTQLFDIHICDIGADKQHAVTALRAIAHSMPSQTLAIGDSTNDLPLFRGADLTVAMGNAIELLKAQANYVTAGVEADGFARAMYRFVLT